jgi:phosphorylated CTD-interacting factor 1
MSKSKSKKRKHASNDLGNVCNITGLNGNHSTQDNVLDCLEELASAQVVPLPSDHPVKEIKSVNASQRSTTNNISPIHHRIPNLKIELSRHLQISSLSTFLLQSCRGLRMPTFERWLLDSKCEEWTRMESILNEWEEDPSLKLHVGGKKKKYGRAALYGDLNKQKEERRKNKESRMLFSLQVPYDTRGDWLRNNLDTDPILPMEPLETDPSSLRLLEEVMAVFSAAGVEDARQRATEIVRELCSRTIEVVTNLAHNEARLGRYQKFGWDINPTTTTKKKKREKTCGVDKIGIEWNDDESICTLIYTQKRKRPDTTAEKDGDDGKHKAKPFVLKLNAKHYHKLHAMFDKAREDPCNTQDQLSKSQLVHVFHFSVFAMVIRYSSLSGGQQLNDLRGGGMQGAIHSQVFDCFTRWFGERGVECFASPFNCHLSEFYSAFSSDVDGFFGSFGDFFYSQELLRDGCWYELNPPFSPGVMDKMAERICDLLEVASSQDMRVTFIVIVPSVQDDTKQRSFGAPAKKKTRKEKKRSHDEDTAIVNPVSSLVHQSASVSFHRLVRNSHCTSHIILPAREHGYVEGSQHLRPTMYKESKYSTSVIILQSRVDNNILADGTGRKWDDNLFEKDLREAFASRHAIETQQRKNND